MASQKLFKVHFTSGMPPMIAQGTSRSKVAKAVKKQYGARAIGTIENVSRDGAIGFGFLPMQWQEEKEEGTKNTLELKVAKSDDEDESEDETEEEGEERDDGEGGEKGVKIDGSSPDANGDGKVDAKDDLNGDGVVDAKDLKIAELEKDLKIKRLEKSLDQLDDGLPEVEAPKAPERPTIKDRGDHFEVMDHKGDTLQKFPYERDTARATREEARRWISRWYDEQINGKSGGKPEAKDEGEDKDTDDKKKEAVKEDYIPFPTDYVSVNEVVELDARTKTFKETLKRLQYAKAKIDETDVDNDGLEDEEEPDTNGDGKHDDKDHERVAEGNAFIFAAAKAKKEGKKDFTFNGKKYKVTLKKHSLSEAGYNDAPKTKEEMDKKNPDLKTDIKNKKSKDLQVLTVKEATETEQLKAMVEAIDVSAMILLAKAGLVSKANLADMKVALKTLEDDKPLKPQHRNVVVDIFQKLADLVTNDKTIMQKAKKSFKEEAELEEKAVSKAQQRFMGMVHAAQKGEKPASKEVADVAKDMKKKDAKDFASTKHAGLPDRVTEELVLELSLFRIDENDTNWEKSIRDQKLKKQLAAIKPQDKDTLLKLALMLSKEKDYEKKVVAHLKKKYNESTEVEENEEEQIDELSRGTLLRYQTKASDSKGHRKLSAAKQDRRYAGVNKAAKRLSREETEVQEEEDPCWDDYEMVGMKDKNGKKVPNCVPKEEVKESVSNVYANYIKFTKR